MTNHRHLAVIGAHAFALAACSGGVEGTAPSGYTNDATAGPGTTSTGNGAGGSGGSTSTGSTSSTNGGTAETCVPGIPASSQIPRLEKRQYDAVVRDLLGITSLASTGRPPSDGLYADFDGPVNVDAWRLYQEVAERIAAEVMAGPNRSRFISCDPAVGGCLTETIKTFGRKAFRRPLTDAEVARFERLSQTTPPGTPEQVAESTLHAFLVSPSFLQIAELQTTEMEAGAIKLSDYEVAARLSFLIWGSIPDDVLSAAADRGELQTKEQILAQAERMIAEREKTAPLIAAYHREYLDMDNEDSHWWKVSHDSTKFPAYSDAAVPALQAELDLFFEDLVFEGGSFADLFLSNVGYVNQDTAAIYGLDPGAYGPDPTRVELDPGQRPGFLTRAGFLSSFSHFDATSPILRGAYITVNIIGVNPGAPDPDFFLTPAPEGPHYTEREYVETLTEQPACTGCHTRYVNPPGFALENYDAIGKWQTVDPRSGGDAMAGAIDPSVTVYLSTDDAKMISSPLELMQEISKAPLARQVYAKKLVSFATGRLPNPNDDCTVDWIDMKLSQDGYTLLNLFADLTQTDAFRLRVREN